MAEEDPLQAVLAAAVRLLARREHSRLELAAKLARRGHPDGLIGQALDRLEDDGSLSDARFAEVYARGRAERGYGPRRIRQELRQRGVPDAIADAALAALDVDWRARARAVHRKRFGDAASGDWKARARQLRYLQDRGFDPDFLRDFPDDAE